jgi:hypothetical protein
LVKLNIEKSLGKSNYSRDNSLAKRSISTKNSLENQIRGVRFKEDCKNGIKPIIVSPMKISPAKS